jgi:hypothetical protein
MWLFRLWQEWLSWHAYWVIDLLNNKVVLELCSERAQAREMAYRDSVYLSSSFLHNHFVSLHSPFSLPPYERKKRKPKQPNPTQTKKNQKKPNRKEIQLWHTIVIMLLLSSIFYMFIASSLFFFFSFEILQIIHHVCWFFLWSKNLSPIFNTQSRRQCLVRLHPLDLILKNFQIGVYRTRLPVHCLLLTLVSCRHGYGWSGGNVMICLWLYRSL